MSRRRVFVEIKLPPEVDPELFEMALAQTLAANQINGRIVRKRSRLRVQIKSNLSKQVFEDFMVDAMKQAREIHGGKP